MKGVDLQSKKELKLFSREILKKIFYLKPEKKAKKKYVKGEYKYKALFIIQKRFMTGRN